MFLCVCHLRFAGLQSLITLLTSPLLSLLTSPFSLRSPYSLFHPIYKTTTTTTNRYGYLGKLHNLPKEIKQQYSQRDGHGAYSGADIGQAELAYDPTTSASVRAWDYSRTRFTLKQGDEDGGGNRYPGIDVVEPDYTKFVDDLYERQDVLGTALMIAMAECLHLPPSTFSDMFRGGDFGTIRLLSYPETDGETAEAANIGISAHTDFEAFTLMHQDAAGLQFVPAESSTGEWIDAPVFKGSFVVIVGDVLERMTNGVLKATPHRVVTTSHRRQSIIRFNAVTAETIVAPLDSFITKDRPSSYSSVTMKTHMETTMKNLELGLGAWDEKTQQSLTASYLYVNGKDWREMEKE